MFGNCKCESSLAEERIKVTKSLCQIKERVYFFFGVLSVYSSVVQHPRQAYYWNVWMILMRLRGCVHARRDLGPTQSDDKVHWHRPAWRGAIVKWRETEPTNPQSLSHLSNPPPPPWQIPNTQFQIFIIGIHREKGSAAPLGWDRYSRVTLVGEPGDVVDYKREILKEDDFRT